MKSSSPVQSPELKGKMHSFPCKYPEKKTMKEPLTTKSSFIHSSIHPNDPRIIPISDSYI